MMGNRRLTSLCEEALAIFEQLGDMGGVALVSNNLGAEAYFDGRWDAARDAYAKSREAELRNGNDVAAAIPMANAAELLINQGRFDEAEPTLVDAIRILRASGYPATGFFETQLARLLILRGDFVEAEALLDRITAEGRASDERASLLNAAIQRVDLRLRQGMPHEGLRVLDEIAAEAGAMPEVFWPVLARLRAAGFAALGQFDKAMTQIELGLENARQQALLYEQALLLDLRCETMLVEGETPSRDDVVEADRLFTKLGVVRESIAQLRAR
jgi:ATP/maltotriose-dependent transcriptional regulator MalT